MKKFKLLINTLGLKKGEIFTEEEDRWVHSTNKLVIGLKLALPLNLVEKLPKEFELL